MYRLSFVGMHNCSCQEESSLCLCSRGVNSITTGVMFVDWINLAQDRNKGRLLWTWKCNLGLKKYGKLVAFKNDCVLCSQSGQSCQSVSQPVSQPASQSVSQPASQPVSQSINQVSQPISQSAKSASQSVNQSVSKSISQ